jgi:hypothetical protein
LSCDRATQGNTSGTTSVTRSRTCGSRCIRAAKIRDITDQDLPSLHGDPEQLKRGDLAVVNIALHMEKQLGEFRVTFHPDGTVTGLYFLRAGVPVP